MLKSAEVRWFFRGELPRRAREWFCVGDLWSPQSTRVDKYVVFPGSTAAGVKLRESRFEVKVRVDEPVPVTYANGVRGYRDTWVKWSRGLGRLDVARTFLGSADDDWVHVGKNRCLRGFSLDGGAPREVDAAGARPVVGCTVEITDVNVLSPSESGWWTLGLEAFAEAGSVVDALEQVADHFFAGHPPPMALEQASSRSYVAWLATRFWESGADD